MESGANRSKGLCLNRCNVRGEFQDGTQVRGNPGSYFGLGIVAFLDLLGFSDSVINRWGDGEESPLARLLRIKDNPLVGRGLSMKTGSYQVDAEGVARSGDTYEVKVHTVSDSFALSVALPEVCTLGDFVLAFSCIAMNLRPVWGAALDEGYVLRGAAEIDGVFWSERELVGPALARAYWLETHQANTARVILGPKLLLLLADACERDQYDWASFVRRNDDGLISFDPRVQVTRTADIVKLRDAVREDDGKLAKYRDLVGADNQPVELAVPTVGQLREAARQLSASHR